MANARFDPVPIALVGKHTRLEPLDRGHAEGIFEAGRFEPIWEHMTIPPLRSVADAERFIDSALEERDAGRHLPFATIDVATSRVVGSTRYLDIQRPNRSLEIGFTWITPASQRTAINTEAKRLMLGHAFDTLGAIRVQLKTDRLNERSQRAMERIGATREGTLRNHMILYSGRVRDTVYFSVIDSEWQRVKERLDGMLDRT